MNNKEILTKAVEKAIKNGWNVSTTMIEDTMWVQEDLVHSSVLLNSAPEIIYRHSFAKALWGDTAPPVELSIKDANGSSLLSENPTIPWQYHLQQMVITDDPIKYLGENI